MQAPNPLQRTSLPIPIRRPRHVGHPMSTTPISRLLLGAFALTACRTWVLDSPGHGGEGLLVIAFWGWKISGAVRRAMRRHRKGKEKEKEVNPHELSGHEWALAVLDGAQSAVFMHSMTGIGPLRTLVITTSSSLFPSQLGKLYRSVLPMMPACLACLAILSHPLTSGDYVPAAMTVTLFAMGIGRRRIAESFRSARKPGSPAALETNVLGFLVSGAIAGSLVITSWLSGFSSSPFAIGYSQDTHRLLFFAAAFLSSQLPMFSHRTTKDKPSIVPSRESLILLLATFAFQFFAFPPRPSSLDGLIIVPLIALTLAFQPGANTAGGDSGRKWSFSAQDVSAATSSSLISLVPAAWRPHLRTILHTPTSSRIFYFLLLNLCYMAVQMGYGVLTNSLGLISDAIHMLFDCLGLGVGLWASVAATWKPDGLYTFGYSRVETLSGFANGCFLILVSLSIIFEGIQRIFNPPEMDTRQLLLVSAIGLAINLWGMYATGGHHHHGHSHGHDHGHSHGHVHVAVNEKKEDHRHRHTTPPPTDNRRSSTGSSMAFESSPGRTTIRRKASGPIGELHALSKTNGKQHSREHSSGHSHAHHDHGTGDHGHENSHDHHEDTDEKAKRHNSLLANGHHHDHSGHDCSEHDHGHGHSHTAHSHATHEHTSHDHDHEHSHDHAHSHNMRGVFLHVLADTLGSVGVIISTVLIRFTGWTGWDPLASLFIAALIMASVIPLVIDSAKVLCLDVGATKEAEIRSALGELSGIEGLSTYSSPRFWPRCEGSIVGSIHIQLALSPSAYDPTRSHTPYLHKGPAIYANLDRVVGRVDKLLKSRIHGLEELVIQVEGSEEKAFCSCMTGA